MRENCGHNYVQEEYAVRRKSMWITYRKGRTVPSMSNKQENVRRNLVIIYGLRSKPNQ